MPKLKKKPMTKKEYEKFWRLAKKDADRMVKDTPTEDKPKEDWEKKLDKLIDPYRWVDGEEQMDLLVSEIKDFIRTLLAKEKLKELK
jgi:hypothetical protein